MKKAIMVSISVLLSMGLLSCGGETETGSLSDASIASAIIVPAMVGGVCACSNAVAVNESETVPIDFTFTCGTSGSSTTTGSVTVDIGTTTAEINGSLETVFTNCAGTDTRCNIDYVLNGTVNSTTSATASGYDTKINVAQSGTVNVTGFTTFSCPIDTVTSISYNDVETLNTEDVTVIFDYMTGTICGKTIAEIKTLIEGDDATYCAGITPETGA